MKSDGDLLRDGFHAVSRKASTKLSTKPHRIVSPPFIEFAYQREELGVVALPREARCYRWLIDQVRYDTASRALGRGNSVPEVARLAAREDSEANDWEGTLE